MSIASEITRLRNAAHGDSSISSGKGSVDRSIEQSVKNWALSPTDYKLDNMAEAIADVPVKNIADKTINCGNYYTVAKGYHKRSFKVTANSLSSQTGVDSDQTAISADYVYTGYQGWVNGTKITGTMPDAAFTFNVPGTKQPTITRSAFTISGIVDGAAGAATTTTPTSSSTNKVYVKVSSAANTATYTPTATVSTQGRTTAANTTYTGTATSYGASASAATYVPINVSSGASATSLDCGASATVGVGYVTSQITITANSLSSQTSGTATAAQILKDQTAWVSGSKVTGTMTNNGAGGTYTLDGTTTSKEIAAGYWSSKNTVSVNTMAAPTITLSSSSQTVSCKDKMMTGNITIPAVNFYYTGSSAPTSATGYTNGDIFLVV